MPKFERDYLFWQRKAAKKTAAKNAKREARAREKLATREERRAARALVKISHLRRKLSRATRYPSMLTVRQLRDMAGNQELPAEARVEAARLITQWLFAEPAELEAAPHVRRRPRRRD
jgi:hypothetical protein